jgi:Mrp family chromosome partitioning ATPase/capsular polysaccharide biosynthesis protein
MNPPDAEAARDSAGAPWRRPQLGTSGFERYLHTLRERLPLIAAVTLATTIVAALYLAVAEDKYRAEADLLVSPASQNDTALTGLPVIHESSDPTRDVSTAARLVTSRDVAARVKRKLGLDESVGELQGAVSAEPVAQSNIVSVRAEAESPELAADIANGFATEVVAARSEELRRAIDQQLPRIREQIAAAAERGQDTQVLSGQLVRLESLRATGDPTLRVETRAQPPASAFAPRPALTLAAGILAGLILGVGGAFAMSALDPRLRREEQLRELYSLPILARVPREKRARTFSFGERRWGFGPRAKLRHALPPAELSPMTLESFRTLRTMLAAQRGSGREGRSILITGPSPQDGKTTTALNLASSLALADNRVILIEADFRRPTVGEALGIQARAGIGDVLLGNVPLESALVPAPPFDYNLSVLLVDRADDWLAEVLSLPAAETLLEEAKALADYVVLDTPPLTQVIDAMPLARQVDDVVLVVRLGSSNLAQLARLGDLLDQNAIRPAGFVVVGGASAEEQGDYRTAQRRRAPEVEWMMPPESEEKPIFPAER